MRSIVALGALLVATALAGCVSEVSTADFELKPTEVGWRAGQEALFLLRFTPDGDTLHTYDIDPVFAIEEIRFEKGGLNAFGDFETKRAADVSVALVQEGTVVSNWTLTPSAAQVGIRLKLPESLDNDAYTLEMKLFKVGWIESDVFRVAI